MNKVKFFYKYPIDVDIDTDREVNVYIDEFDTTHVRDGEIRIVITDEPLKSTFFHLTECYSNSYTRLLTFHESILANNDKAILFHSSGARPWIKHYESPNKAFSVSALVGGKDEPRMTGYALRHELWYAQWRITTPKDFYLSSHSVWRKVDYKGQKVLGNDKTPLFDSMFHIAIENIPIQDYFTEKILDCFRSYTVPIYVGCKNIEDYFNIDGIIRVNSLDEIVDACNNLTPDVYEKMKPAMEDNYNRSLKWSSYEDRVKQAILDIISK
jgi:hypothetical protein